MSSIVGFAAGIDRSGPGFTSSATLAGCQVGDELWAYVRYNGSTITVGNVTCAGESNLTAIGSVLGGGPNSRSGQWFKGAVTGSNGSRTVSWAPGSAGGSDVYCVELWVTRGTAGNDGNDFHNDGTGTAASASFTPGFQHDIVLGVVSTDGGEATAVGGGATQRTMTNIWGYDDGLDLADAGTSAPASVSATVPSSNWRIHGLAVKASGASAIAGAGATFVVAMGL